MNARTKAPKWRNRITRWDPDCPIAKIHPNDANWRRHPEQQRKAITAMLGEVGWVGWILVAESTGTIVDGHLRYEEAIRAKETTVPVAWTDLTEDEVAMVLATLDPIGAMAQADDHALEALLDSITTDNDEVAALLASLRPPEGAGVQIGTPGSMTDTFGVPPFSVLDARQGSWQDRKRAWIRLGIDSGEGRPDDLLLAPEGKSLITQRIRKVGAGTSIFDPVLAELAVRWFCPQGGHVLDPFAGGSVRGIVSALCGRAYTGIDVRQEQVIANEAQWRAISGASLTETEEPPDHMPDLTPVEAHGDIWIKRDDTFAVAGVRGGKVRTCWALAQGAAGLVTAGSRASPQVNIVAHVAKALGLPCRVHVPAGDLAPEVQAAMQAGAEVEQHKARHNSVIIARAREDAAETGWTEIPFGMECDEAIRQTMTQVRNLPPEVARIVVPVGSGMSLAGILTGLADAGNDTLVLGVVVGADPTKRLDEYAPAGWRDRVTLVQSGTDYHEPAACTEVSGIQLDPHYEAKCIPFIQPGDCLWVVGIRQTAVQVPASCAEESAGPCWITGDSRDMPRLLPLDGPGFDLVLSCPPYADLEVYSDDPRDISTMDYPEFRAAYREIIAAAVARLKPNRYAVWVVGEVRDADGMMLGFVRDTINAFEDAGARLYNEAVLVTAAGSLPLRAGKIFRGSRKLGKGHQNVLVFTNGDSPEPIDVKFLGVTMADEFMRRQKLIQSHEAVLVFAKGDPVQAAEAAGTINMALPDEPDAA